MAAGQTESTRRGVFEVDETAALAELETIWAAGGLPRRPTAGGAHRAPGPDRPGLAVLRRVRDALASGRQP